MITVAFSLLASLCYGIGGYLGGSNTRKFGITTILPVVLFFGALTVTAAIPLVGAEFNFEVYRSAGFALVVGLIGYATVYRAIAIGPMGIASAIISVICAGIPFLVSILRGDAITSIGVLGAVLALISIIMVCKSSEDAKHPVTKKMVVVAITGGLAAAGFVLALASAPKSSGIGVFVVTRWLQVLALTIFAIANRKKYSFLKVDFRALLTIGVVDTMASIFLILAAHSGSLGLVSILSNMSPVVTLTIAHFLIHERVERHQIVGIFGACASVAMLSLA